MPGLDAAAVRDIVRQLRNDFANLHDACRFRWDIVHARHGSAKTATQGTNIDAMLQLAGYKVRVPVVSREVDYAANKVVAALGTPQYEVHIEPDRDSDKSRADKLELIDANLLLQIADPVFDLAVHRHQAISAFAPVWLERNPYNLPQRKSGEGADDYNKRVQRWREEYVAFRLMVGDPTSCAFMEDGNLNVTLAVREYDVPFVDLVAKYGDYDREAYAAGEEDPDLMFKLYDTQFRQIRAAYGMEPNRDAFHSQDKVRIVEVDDGFHICHYVIMGKMSEDRNMKGRMIEPNGVQYEPMGNHAAEGKWPNPFRRPGLFPIPGHFNPEAVKPEDRYTPILLPMIQSRWNLDMTWSQWASKAAEVPTFVSPLAPETASVIANMTREERAEFFDNIPPLTPDGVNYIVGSKPEPLQNTPNEFLQTLYQEQRNEHSQYVPQSVFSGTESSQNVLKSTPASTLLRLDELADMDYDQPFKLKFRAMIQILECHDRYWMENPHGPNKPGRKSDEPYYAITTGRERVKGREIKRGLRVEFKPSDFDFGFTRSINRIDNRASTLAANLELINMRMQMADGKRYVTEEEVITALGKTNATEYLKQLRAEQRADMLRQANDALALAASVRQVALEQGVDVTQYLQNTAAAGQAPQLSGGNNGMSGMQLRPPARDAAPVGVQG